MSKKNYYTGTTGSSYSYEDLRLSSPYLNTDLRIHEDHMSVLDIDFEIGQLVETYNGDLGIVSEVLSGFSDDNRLDPCDIMYKVQVGVKIEYWMALSLKKIKKT